MSEMQPGIGLGQETEPTKENPPSVQELKELLESVFPDCFEPGILDEDPSLPFDEVLGLALTIALEAGLDEEELISALVQAGLLEPETE